MKRTLSVSGCGSEGIWIFIDMFDGGVLREFIAETVDVAWNIIRVSACFICSACVYSHVSFYSFFLPAGVAVDRSYTQSSLARCRVGRFRPRFISSAKTTHRGLFNHEFFIWILALTLVTGSRWERMREKEEQTLRLVTELFQLTASLRNK